MSRIVTPKVHKDILTLDDILDQALEVAEEDVVSSASSSIYTHFQKDPVGFGTKVLGHKYTDDIKPMLQSIVDNVITIAPSATAVGKSYAAAAAAIWWYKSYADSQVYTLCAPPEENLRRILWGEIGGMVQKNPELFEGDIVTNLQIVKKNNIKSFIAGVTIPTTGTEKDREARVSGKHAPHLLFIIDEGDAVPREIYRGISGCMSGGHSRLLILFNPRQKMGVPYEYETTGKAKVFNLSALTHPNVVKGRDVIPGAVTREDVLRKIHEYTKVASDVDIVGSPENIFHTPMYLMNEEVVSTGGEPIPAPGPLPRIVIDPTFHYQVLGKYPTVSQNQLIEEKWIDDAQMRYTTFMAMYGDRIRETQHPSLGLDVSEQGKDRSTLAIRYGQFLMEILEWPNMPLEVLSEVVAEIHLMRNAKETFVDATGLGAQTPGTMTKLGCKNVHRVIYKKSPVAPRGTPLREKARATEDAKNTYENYRAQLFFLLREWMSKPDTIIPDNAQLKEELLIPKFFKNITNNKIDVTSSKLMKNSKGQSLDLLNAMALSVAIPQEVKQSAVWAVKY